MAADATTLFIPGHGTVFHSPVGTALPVDPLTAFTLTGAPPTGWDTFGHTSKQNIVNFTREGGETTTLDTFLADSVRSVVTSTARTTLNIAALQLDVDTLDLAFNGDWDETGNRYVVPASSSAIERALVVLLTDDTGSMLFEIPKGSISASGTFTLDPANFVEIPLAATLLSSDSLPAVNGQAALFAIHKANLDPTPPV